MSSGRGHFDILGKQFWEVKEDFAGGWDNQRVSDGSTTLAVSNRHWTWLHFGHVPTGNVVSFKAFVTGFTQTFEQVWEETNSYGRMDPIKTFTRTGRKISLQWSVVAESRDDAFRNIDRCNALAHLQYPMYSEDGIMQAAPLIRVRWINMIKNAGHGSTDGGGGTSGHPGPNNGGVGGDTYGLVCTMSGFTWEPDMEMGFVEGHATDGDEGYPAMAPKYIKMSTELTVLHTHKLGWNEDKTPRIETETNSYFGAGNFPMMSGMPYADPDGSKARAAIEDFLEAASSIGDDIEEAGGLSNYLGNELGDISDDLVSLIEGGAEMASPGVSAIGGLLGLGGDDND